MGKPCRLTFFAYMHGASNPRGYDKDDLLNGHTLCLLVA